MRVGVYERLPPFHRRMGHFLFPGGDGHYPRRTIGTGQHRA
jgi:hypothetical protein